MKKLVLTLTSMIAFSVSAMVVSTGLSLKQPRNCSSFYPHQKEGNPYESFRIAKEIVAMMHNSARYKLNDPQKKAVQYLNENLDDLFKNTGKLKPLAQYHPQKYYRMETVIDRSHKKLNSMIWLGINQLKNKNKNDQIRIRRIYDSVEYLNDCFNGDQRCQQARDRKRKLITLYNSRKKQNSENAANKRRKIDSNQMPITSYFQHKPESPEV